MRPVSSKFLRTLGLALIGLLVLLLLAFFVMMFFAEKRGDSYRGVYGSPMMRKSVTAMPANRSGLPSPMDMSQESDGLMMDRATGGAMMEKSAVSVGMMTTAPATITERKVVKTGNLSVQVGNVDETVARMRSVAGELGGMMSDSHLDQVIGGSKSGTVTVKVATDKFDEALTRLKALANVTLSEDVSGTDVTAQVIDLEARIHNQKAAEATLQTLFDRAVKISDVMEITDRLAAVRSEIESLEGQKRYLDSQTSLATITVFMTEDVQVKADQGFRPMQTLKASLLSLLQFFGDIVEGSIRFLIVGLPALVIDGLLLWAIYLAVRRALTKFWPGLLEEKRRVLRKK